MTRMTDLYRVKVVTAHANGDLDELRAMALAALDDLDVVLRAYDDLAAAAAGVPGAVAS